jgi:RNA polymerase sigma factor (TIGR02999 family)
LAHDPASQICRYAVPAPAGQRRLLRPIVQSLLPRDRTAGVLAHGRTVPDVANAMTSTDEDITALLARWRGGEKRAEKVLLDAVYPALRDIARARLHRTPGELTLSATDLAHETYARLAGKKDFEYRDRTHFFAMAARAVRYYVIDHVRARNSEKRGGQLPFVPLHDLGADEPGGNDGIDLRIDWLAVHTALDALERIDQTCAQIVELKFFSGLTLDEIAEVTAISRASVVRNWRFAKAWLADQLQSLA